MRIGIYNKHWNTRGGGEKYAAAIAERLSLQHEVELIGVESIDLPKIESILNVDLSRTRFVEWPYGTCRELADRTSQYDLFINATYNSQMISEAKKSVYVVFFPHKILPHFIAQVGGAIARLAKLFRIRFLSKYELKFAERDDSFLKSYNVLITISDYTQSWTRRRWKRSSQLLFPPVDNQVFRPSAGNTKEKTILSVGRFFAGGHNKKHIEMIEVFRAMCDRGLVPPGWIYKLVGNVHLDNAAHVANFNRIKELAKGYPIEIKTDLSFPELKQEYQRAALFWHASGWGESDANAPELFEHFGITTCEALSAGCIPVVIAKAGQLEIIQEAQNGFLFTSAEELINKTMGLIEKYGSAELDQLSQACIKSAENYSRDRFNQRVDAIFASAAKL